MSGKIFVSRVTPEMSEDDIKSYFGQFGELSYIFLPRNPFRAFCFLTYVDPQVARQVCEQEEEHLINNISVSVNIAKGKSERENEAQRKEKGGYREDYGRFREDSGRFREESGRYRRHDYRRNDFPPWGNGPMDQGGFGQRLDYPPMPRGPPPRSFGRGYDMNEFGPCGGPFDEGYGDEFSYRPRDNGFGRPLLATPDMSGPWPPYNEPSVPFFNQGYGRQGYNAPKQNKQTSQKASKAQPKKPPKKPSSPIGPVVEKKPLKALGEADRDHSELPIAFGKQY